MKKIMLICWLVCLALGAFTATSGQDKIVVSRELITEAMSARSPQETEALLKKYAALPDKEKTVLSGIVRFHLALSGDETAVTAAMEANRIAWESARLPLSRGYYGSAEVLYARNLLEKSDFDGAMQYLQQGIAGIDEAVSLSPEDPLLRNLRLETLWNVAQNSPVQRVETIREDIEALLKMPEKLDPNILATAYLYQGILLEREGKTHEALAGYEKAAKACPGCPSGIRAKELLQSKR